MEEDWGLQAIVRGCTHDNYMTNTNLFDDFTNYYHDDIFYSFPDFQEVENSNDNNSFIVNELDDLYNNKSVYDPTVGSFSPVSDVSKSVVDEELVKLEKLAEDDHVKETALINVKPKAATPSTKYKRKNQLKRVVVQVTAEGLSSDLWAWRKYGQKPIKGSPYPRSYYRCSSSKGCLARKQVEQSCSDPGMYIITYTAEHNHSHPTRRSSLAGTNRQKFTTLKRTSSGESCVSSSSTTRKENSNSSPTSQMIVPRVDEVQTHKKMKHEKIDRTVYDHEEMVQEINGGDDEFIIPDSILTDDFFVGLDDLDGLISKSSFYSSSSQQLR